MPNLQPAQSPWGVSDLRDVVGLNRELNERPSDQADPPVVFSGVTDHSDLTVGPGTVWDLPNDADVKLLEWRGVAPAVQAHLELVLRAIWPPIVPKDDAQEVRNNLALVSAGLRSHRTAMDALGTEDPEAELRRVLDDRARLLTAPSPTGR